MSGYIFALYSIKSEGSYCKPESPGVQKRKNRSLNFKSGFLMMNITHYVSNGYSLLKFTLFHKGQKPITI